LYSDIVFLAAVGKDVYLFAGKESSLFLEDFEVAKIAEQARSEGNEAYHRLFR